MITDTELDQHLARLEEILYCLGVCHYLVHSARAGALYGTCHVKWIKRFVHEVTRELEDLHRELEELQP